MRQDYLRRRDSAGLAAVSHTLVTLQQWTFNLGPGVVVGVGNGLILGYMMYRTGLVPRGMAMLGLVGGPLIVLSGTAVMFGVIEAGSAAQSARQHPGVLLGAQLRRLPDREGLQALRRHRRHGGRTMITVEDVTRTYGNFTAVDNVTFTAQPGRVTGFLGPNGAGKSTTMRIIVGLTAPTHGTAHVLGRRFADLPNPGLEVGVLLDASAQHAGRTGREVLTVGAQDDGPARDPGRRRCSSSSASPTVRPTRRVRDYSLGMRQRLGIAHALLGDPEVLILDEPANGLDPAGIRWMRDLLRGYADRGSTVLLSSHLLHEIEVVADDLVVIGNGRIVAHGTKADLLSTAGTQVRTRHPDQLKAALTAAGLTYTDTTPTAPGLTSAPPDLSRGTCCASTPTPSSSASSPTKPGWPSSSSAPPTAPAWRRCSSSSPPTPNAKPTRPTARKEQSHEHHSPQHHHRPARPVDASAARAGATSPARSGAPGRSTPRDPADPDRRRRAAQVLRHPLRVLAAGRHRHRGAPHHRRRHRLGTGRASSATASSHWPSESR